MGNIMSASFAPECDGAKKAYDDCFNQWYSEKFLKAKSVTNECEDTWREYEACIHTALEKKGVKTPLNDLGDDEQDSTHVNSKADTK